MGCQSSYKEYSNKIKKESNNFINQQQIEAISMQSGFEPKEIYFLLLKFKKLEPNFEGKISNSQLLQLPEFKYSPFKHSLIRALGLKQDLSIQDNEPALESRRLKYITDDNAILELDDRIKSDTNNKRTEDRENHKFLLMNNNYLKIEDKNKKNQILDRADLLNNKGQENILKGRQMISFLHFCKIMQVFSPFARPEIKIKCKY